MDRRYVFRFQDGTYYNTLGFYPRPTFDLYEAWVSRYKTEQWLRWERDGKGVIEDVDVTINIVGRTLNESS